MNDINKLHSLLFHLDHEVVPGPHELLRTPFWSEYHGVGKQQRWDALVQGQGNRLRIGVIVEPNLPEGGLKRLEPQVLGVGTILPADINDRRFIPLRLEPMGERFHIGVTNSKKSNMPMVGLPEHVPDAATIWTGLSGD